MSESFAAQPGTMLIKATDTAERGFIFIPIVGWEKTKGGRAAPLVPQVPIAIQHGVAIVMPGNEWVPEVVSDPTYKCTFDSVEKWLAFITEKEDTEGGISGSEDIADLMASVNFGEKSFVKNSYWIFREGEIEFLFEIEGGEPLPDDSRVTKSNRRDFLVMKKVTPVADPNGVPEDGEEDPEPEVEEEDDAGLDEEAEDLI